jgi:hypothetical protein
MVSIQAYSTSYFKIKKHILSDFSLNYSSVSEGGRLNIRKPDGCLLGCYYYL